MLQSFTGNAFLVLGVLVLVAVLLALEGLYLLWKSWKGPGAQKIARRLQALSAVSDPGADTQLLKSGMLSELPTVERLLLRLPQAHQLQGFISQAGLSLTVSKLLLTSLAAAVISYMLVVMLAYQSILNGLLFAVIAAALPFLYVQWKRSRRLQKLERQLPEAIDLLIRSLRAGHAFSPGMQMIAQEMPEPICAEFAIVHDEISFGVSLQQALGNLSERVPLTDLRYFVMAVLIQRESGGNLTEVLAGLSRLIRERLKLTAKVRVLSSEGRLSAWILGVMPFALAGVMNLANPGFMSPLWTDPIGIAIIQYMLSLMAIGILILRKIVRIRV